MSSELGNIPVPLPGIKWNPEKSKDLDSIFLGRQTSLGHNVYSSLFSVDYDCYDLRFSIVGNIHCSYAIDHDMSLSLYLSFGW